MEYGTSKLKTVRQELSRLDPPKWTKQQQPKRVFKSEDHRLSNVLQTNKAVSSSLLRYNARQIQILNKNFIVNRNPLSNEFHRIANETSLDHYQVKKWFRPIVENFVHLQDSGFDEMFSTTITILHLQGFSPV